jgi:FK506-binding protein 4/5
VVKGWDQGIKTMKKGENAVLSIPPELAYGELGSSPTIPPNATLQLDVKLLSWTSAKDTLKKILREGEKWESPKDPDQVLGIFFPFSLIEYLHHSLIGVSYTCFYG